ncbi:MAG: Fe-S protein assembly co-chaperone HscB [Saprospiraceae bacterium]|nr:Fe-S protein assembly co-chaperone HscB [Saprospiraceae bacterium]
MNNYFEFFEIPVAFYLDETALKQRFLKNSKKFHPDFFTLESEEKQAEILELSTYNNQAFLTLSDFDKRLKYILDLKGILADSNHELPNAFLMEMMDINEAIMELEFDFNQTAFDAAKERVGDLEAELFENAKPIMEAYSDTSNNASLEIVKDFFLKKRYLWRIKEKLDSFAPASKEVR